MEIKIKPISFSVKKDLIPVDGGSFLNINDLTTWYNLPKKPKTK